MKRKRIANKFNRKCFIYNKTKHLAKNYRNRAKQENIKKGKTIQANINEVDHLMDKFWNKFICHGFKNKPNQ
jgi:hypothetical protein